MSALTVAPPSKLHLPALQSVALPTKKRWSVSEFHRLSESGIIKGVPTILIDGELVVIPLANHPHDMGIAACSAALSKQFDADNFWVRIQMALPLGQDTDPGPDLAIIAGAWRTHQRQPTTALLVVEVSDSTLRFDTTEKARLYAAGGIADYWVVDINGRQLHLFRDPLKDAVTGEARYATTTVIDAAGSVTALAAQGFSIAVADLLP